MVVEVLRNFRTGEDSCDGRCCEDAIHDDTVAERCRIGQDDRDNVQETDVADLQRSERTIAYTASTMRPTYPVDSVRSCVCLDVVACRFHDRSNDNKQQHTEETFDTAPDIENFCDEEVANTAGDRSNDADDRSQSVFAERRGNVWVEVGLYGGEQRFDELGEIQTECEAN